MSNKQKNFFLIFSVNNEINWNFWGEYPVITYVIVDNFQNICL